MIQKKDQFLRKFHFLDLKEILKNKNNLNIKIVYILFKNEQNKQLDYE